GRRHAEKLGMVERTSQAIKDRSNPLITMAASSPTRRALACSVFGSLPEIIEMKMTLSTPKMISRKVRVARAISPSAVSSASIPHRSTRMQATNVSVGVQESQDISVQARWICLRQCTRGSLKFPNALGNWAPRSWSHIGTELAHARLLHPFMEPYELQNNSESVQASSAGDLPARSPVLPIPHGRAGAVNHTLKNRFSWQSSCLEVVL